MEREEEALEPGTYRNAEGYLVKIIPQGISRPMGVSKLPIPRDTGSSNSKATNGHYSHLDEMHAREKMRRTEGVDSSAESGDSISGSAPQDETVDMSQEPQE